MFRARPRRNLKADEDTLSPAEIRRRAAGGAALLGARSVVVYGLGTVANLVLARLLVPRDFGLVALGTLVIVLGTFLADGGLGAALIRRERSPEPIELRSLATLQLGVTTAIFAVVAALAPLFGRDGLVVTVMAASLPIAIARAPSLTVAERRLEYRVIATTDVVEAIVYYAWALVTVALGLEVWGLATAVVVRAAVGTAFMLARGPLGPVRPGWSWEHARPLLGFGIKVQATGLLAIVREQGINVVVAVVAGTATLGVWNLAWRIVQLPSALFATMGRVGFPALSRLLGSGQDVRAVVERGAGMLTAAISLAVVPVVGFAPAVPEIVGGTWRDVSAALLWSGVALVATAPITVASISYLLAAGEAGTVALGMAASAVVWFAVTAALLPSYGAAAVGLGWVASSGVNATILSRRAAGRSGARVVRHTAIPSAVALAALSAAWAIAHIPTSEVAGGVAGALAGELIVAVGLMLVAPESVRDVRALAMQGALGLRRAPAAPPA